MSNWKWVVFGGAKSHAIPTELFETVVDDLTGRGCEMVSVGSVSADGVFVDRPGMVCNDRPLEHFEVDGLAITIPSEDVEYMYVQLLNSESRGNAAYYKLHGFMKCVVLTGPQRYSLLTQLDERTLTANDRAEEFYSNRSTPAQVLEAANGRPSVEYDRHAVFKGRN